MITAQAGDVQRGVEPVQLRPSRGDLIRARLDHAVRAAAEEGMTVDVTVSPLPVAEKAGSILDLPIT